jgi:hypothetical protein
VHKRGMRHRQDVVVAVWLLVLARACTCTNVLSRDGCLGLGAGRCWAEKQETTRHAVCGLPDLLLTCCGPPSSYFLLEPP